MTITFYILNDVSTDRADRFVCNTIEKYVNARHTVYLHTPSEKEAKKWDDLLWTYREDAFLPHIITQDEEAKAPVAIGYSDEKIRASDVFINLHPDITPAASLFKEVVEVVFPDDLSQMHARERYKHYRQQNHTITTHKLTANDL